ncbi:MAG: hypothetical protein EOP48_00110 [Sphingobacteriales bacterium]|nr:MAG: hypothetical protein EOP48_00110 [Sphingobacteriales bacterium]
MKLFIAMMIATSAILGCSANETPTPITKPKSAESELKTKRPETEQSIATKKSDGQAEETIDLVPGDGVWVFETSAKDCTISFPAFTVENGMLNPVDIYCDSKSYDLKKYVLSYENAVSIESFYEKEHFILERITNDKFKWVSDATNYNSNMVRISKIPLKKPLVLPSVTPPDGLYERPGFNIQNMDCPKGSASIMAIKDGKFGYASFKCKSNSPLDLTTMDPINMASFRTEEEEREHRFFGYFRVKILSANKITLGQWFKGKELEKIAELPEGF